MGTVLDWDALCARRESWRANGEKVVFTNGCFDLLHPGHVRVLERARDCGDRLILAINSDASVKRLKGPSRPILPERERAATLAAFESIDAVTLFDQDTPEELIAYIVPDVLVKGADWSHWIAGREIVEAAGGEVFPIPLEPGYSTTDVVRKILDRHADEIDDSPPIRMM